MDGVAREVNAWELYWTRAGTAACDRWPRFGINKLLFSDDTAVVADSQEKSYRLASEFDSVCEIRKLRVNRGESLSSEVLEECKCGSNHLNNVRLNVE